MIVRAARVNGGLNGCVLLRSLPLTTIPFLSGFAGDSLPIKIAIGALGVRRCRDRVAPRIAASSGTLDQLSSDGGSAQNGEIFVSDANTALRYRECLPSAGPARRSSVVKGEQSVDADHDETTSRRGSCLRLPPLYKLESRDKEQRVCLPFSRPALASLNPSVAPLVD